MITENWLAIDGYINYEISNQGNVRSKDRMIVTIDGKSYIKRGQVLKPKKHKDGYLFITLTDVKRRSNKYVHRLVALAFVENEDNKPQVNHINGIKSNNSANNLEWVTGSENSQHAFYTGLYYRIDLLKHKSKAVINNETGECYNTITDAAHALNRNYSVIRGMLKGRRKKTLSLEYCDAC